MINSYKKPEILAPCGSYDIMIAAINAGADACYFGGNKFGARAYATNFDQETSLKAIEYAHIHGTSLYLTVNTLFKDNEIKDLYNYILPYYEAGLDAVIVQDLGVFDFIRNYFPDMNIHCSTQMNITSRYAAKGMKELGATRIVTAREMNLEDVAQIKKELNIEIESFVHGAMCYSYSGRCLMSSLAGGRSGNRGRCAQPCRKAYDGEYILSMKDMCTLTDVPKLIEAGIDSLKIEGRMKNEYYVASAVDAYNQIASDFVDGCYSENKAEKLKFKLANIYNRGGFCDGYYFMHNGPEMISKDRPNNQGIQLGKVMWAKDGKVGLRLYTDLYKQDVIELKLKDGNIVEITSGIGASANDEVILKCPKTKLVKVGQTALRTRCNHIIADIEENLLVNSRKYELYGDFTAKIGEELRLTIGRYINDKYIQAIVTGDVVQEAHGKAADRDDVRAKLCQLGNTEYTFSDLSIKIDNNAFIPASAIKGLRRQAIVLLEEKISDMYKRNRLLDNGCQEYYNTCVGFDDKFMSKRPEFNVGVTTKDQFNQVINSLYIDNIFVDVNLYESLLRDFDFDILKNRDIKLYLELPLIVKNHFDVAHYLQNKCLDGIYIRNIDGLFAYYEYVRKTGISELNVICGDGVYAYNRLARAFIKNLFPQVEFELPRELNKKELYSLDLESNHLVVYEYQQVMLSAQCVVKNRQGCNKSNAIIRLKDDKNNVFYARAYCHECCNVIYNGTPYMILDHIDEEYYKKMGITAIRFNFTVENKNDIEDVLCAIKEYVMVLDGEYQSMSDNLKSVVKGYTSGHFNRGVE